MSVDPNNDETDANGGTGDAHVGGSNGGDASSDGNSSDGALPASMADDGKTAANAAKRNLIYYIDVEPSVADGDIKKKTARIASASGCSVQVISYRDLINNSASIASMRASTVLAWFVSGSFSEWSDYPAKDLLALKNFLKNEPGDMPIIGVCAGHQLIAMAHGAEIAHMSCFEGENSPADVDCPEAFESSPKGWKTVDVTLLDPSDEIFSGLPTRKFNFSHHDEVTAVPSGFTNLAETSDCAIQLLKHSARLIYTTQFHPEFEVPGKSDGGERLMTNFFAMARNQWGE